MKLHIENMNCGGCARGVTAAIKSLDPQADVKADPPSRSVEVVTSASKEQVEAALCEVGFPPTKD